MHLSMEYLEQWFSQIIGYTAYRYQTRLCSVDDIKQQVLIDLSLSDWPDRPTASSYHKGRVCLTDPAWVNVAIRSFAQRMSLRELRRERVVETPPGLVSGAPSAESIARMKEALATLTPLQKKIVRERLWSKDPSDVRSLAPVLGISPASVSRCLSAARKHLEQCLS